MSLPIAVGVVAALGTAGYYLSDNSTFEIKKSKGSVSGTAVWDMPWSTDDINFELDEKGISKDIHGNYLGSLNGTQITIDNITGDVRDSGENQIKTLSLSK